MMRVSAVAALAAAASGCDIRFANKASKEVTLCLRHNGDAPGTEWQQSLGAVNGTVTVGCHNGGAGGKDSWQTYFSEPGGSCGWNQNCSVNTGTCHYPWSLGQGISADNGNWYGSVGANWDGAGLGYTGDYNKIGYGVNLQCTSYKTQHVNATCTVDAGQPTCTPNHPNYNRPNSGVVLCDPGQTLHVTLMDA
eukprot:TRINITY_DN872_c0_g1_i2.p1 TRINITY_DN872_c0_g1~~TRINITY_DN872_c0_g1_i2.p1  ORF type:complete len:222 (+),score=83.15 TRINITY_DN872_c0_g1_i2:88-666(+)